MPFYVYTLESESGRYYIGYTSYLEQCLSQQNRKHHGSTYRKKEKLKIPISREYETKTETMRVEKNLKRLKNYRVGINLLNSEEY